MVAMSRPLFLSPVGLYKGQGQLSQLLLSTIDGPSIREPDAAVARAFAPATG